MIRSLWARARRSEALADVAGLVAIAAGITGVLLAAVSLGGAS